MKRESKSEEVKKIHQSNDSSSDRENGHNRLVFEKSPYLLQHADNPVDWYPWGEEAFLKAKKEDKPVFLSIGYSACHWCQVMERESFEDEEVAQLMNKYFVAVKVDREERPDIDNIYMTVCQYMTGSGGWPLTIIMTPDKEPFFAGTYFPKQAKFGRPGLIETLNQIASLWEKDRARVLKVGNEVTQTVQNISLSPMSGDLTKENLKQAYQKFQDSFDETHGGFGRAPKFPSAHNLSLLLRWWKRSGEEKALKMVEKTLDAMWKGGMYDHLGFGFHRYSTDSRWLVPHFEKMLYDQAMLAIAYVEAYQATGKAQYAEVAREIFIYVLRDMTSPEGAFYSSENADSEGEEGKFYVWTQDEIKAILGEEQGDLFCKFYGVTKKGNLEGSKSVLHISRSLEEFARNEGMAPDELKKILEQSRQKLFAAREKRIHPSKDDKILTDWNGLMIVAFSKGAQALNEPEYADAARKAADFLLKELRRKDGRLLHRYREGEAALPGYVDDYAFLVWGLIDLYETTFEARYLQEALTLTDDMLKLFWDEKEGGLYFTGDDNEKLISRMKDVYDGAIPSGNSVASLNLLRLGRITMRQELEEKAEQAIESFGKTISRSPTGFSQFLIALDFAVGPTKEIVIAGDLHQEDTNLMLHAVRRRFLPGKVLILHPEGEDGKAIEKIVPFVKHQNEINGKATAYVCESYTCKAPTTDLAKMISFIESH
ncbi:MAG: thioredoxin domain-containing protein [Candidatus Aminicenantes bacterium]|nr:MAG: thioredoxin domain-containing protein [Candidatus Aminicenantes bacterium]